MHPYEQLPKVAQFFETVRRTGVLELARLKEVHISPPNDPDIREFLAIYQYLIFGKPRPYLPEQGWYQPLSKREQKALQFFGPIVRCSAPAAYPETVDNWNVLNRIVDLALISFDHAQLAIYWDTLMQNSE